MQLHLLLVDMRCICSAGNCEAALNATMFQHNRQKVSRDRNIKAQYRKSKNLFSVSSSFKLHFNSVVFQSKQLNFEIFFFLDGQKITDNVENTHSGPVAKLFNSNSTLRIIPTSSDANATYACVMTNDAMAGETKQNTIKLNLLGELSLGQRNLQLCNVAIFQNPPKYRYSCRAPFTKETR